MRPIEVKHSIESLIGKEMKVEDMGKVVQLSVFFYILSKGCALTDNPSLSSLLHFGKKNYYTKSHLSINNG